MGIATELFVIERTQNGERSYWARSSHHGTGWSNSAKQSFTKTEVQAEVIAILAFNSDPFTIRPLFIPDDITPTQTSPSPEPERRPEVEKVMLDALLAAKAVLGRMCTNWDEFTKVRYAVELAKENPALKKESYRGVIGTTFSDKGKTDAIMIQFQEGNKPPVGSGWTSDPPREHPWYKKSVTVTIED